MPEVARQEEMEELLASNAKRLKTIEIVSVNSTSNTSLYFATPSSKDIDFETFIGEQEGLEPTFTYPFFGQEEAWKGVEKGSLRICFDPQSFYAFIDFQVDEDAENLKAGILEKLTVKMAKGSWTTNWPEFIQMCSSFTGSLKSLGTVQDQFEDEEGGELAFLECSFENQEFRKFHERVQILLLFYIEAASFIDDEDLKWRCYTMFTKEDGHWHLIGYTTLYPFLFYPDKTRMRLSQFLILPYYHRMGYGSQLYRHVYQQILLSEDIKELTVEDPSEEFCIFRLRNDYQVYSAFPEAPARSDLKYSEAEYEKLVQLDQFRKIKGDEKNQKFRIEVKKALWRANKETMPDEAEGRKQVLQELYEERISLFKQVLKIAD